MFDALLVSTGTVALAEIGDKTQVATVLLAAKYPVLWQVVAGTTIGMLLANVPVVALGTFILVMAAVFHVRRATWRLRVDAESVALDMQAANGRSMKHESLRIEDIVALVWVDGDDDVSAGIRLRAGSGASLFVPADAFDVQAAWDATSPDRLSAWPAIRSRWFSGRTAAVDANRAKAQQPILVQERS